MTIPRWQQMKPAWYKQAYFLPKPRSLEKDWPALRALGQRKLSAKAQLKLEWLIFYHTLGRKRTGTTATQFGLSRKSLHKWKKRFELFGLLGLEEMSRAPHKRRQRQISLTQRIRIEKLRRKYLKLGKMKLSTLYAKEYGENVSSWKIQKVIEEADLYPDKAARKKWQRRQEQARAHHKKRISELTKQNKVNYLWHVDTVILTLASGGYRYLLTAIDEVSKLAFARLYTTHSSRNAKDFLQRLVYLTENRVVNLHHDNGSEFKKEFEEACGHLNIPQWYSRSHTPADNGVLERFNRTIQEEFVEMSEVDPLFVEDFNRALTDWLVHYNYQRPHQALAYQTPLEYLDVYYQKVLPMYSSHTNY